MGKVKYKSIKQLADSVMEDTIVSPSEFITVPGNTIEKYVDGLIESDVDTTGMEKEQVEMLKKLLIEACQKEISESAS